MSNLLKNLLFALGLAVILWLGYSLFLKEEDSLITESNDRVENKSSAEVQEFLIRLKQIKEVKIETTLFEDERFLALFNFRQDLGEIESGRQNPFASIGEEE